MQSTRQQNSPRRQNARTQEVREIASDLRQNWSPAEREHRRLMAKLMQERLFECARIS